MALSGEIIRFTGFHIFVKKKSAMSNVIYLLQFDKRIIMKFDMTGTKVVDLPGNNNDTKHENRTEHCTCRPRAKAAL